MCNYGFYLAFYLYCIPAAGVVLYGCSIYLYTKQYVM